MERLRCNKGGANVNNKYGKDRVLRTRRFTYIQGEFKMVIKNIVVCSQRIGLYE